MPSRDTCELIAAAALVVVVGARASFGEQELGRKPTAKFPVIDVSLKDGWHVVIYEGCQFLVPRSWQADADGSLARAPDGSNLSIRMFKIASWSAHRALIKSAFGHVNAVHEDSERRLWLEIGDKTRVVHYIAVPSGVTVCAALLEIHATTLSDVQNTTTRIANSIAPAP